MDVYVIEPHRYVYNLSAHIMLLFCLFNDALSDAYIINTLDFNVTEANSEMPLDNCGLLL
jgi:hypothetical protein